MSFNKEFEDSFFNNTQKYFRHSNRTAFRASNVPTFEDLVHSKILKFDTLINKGIKVQAYREGEYHLDLSNFSDISADELCSIILADNPTIDLTFQPEYKSFRPNEELLKPSSVPLWIISKGATANSVRISRVWSN